MTGGGAEAVLAEGDVEMCSGVLVSLDRFVKTLRGRKGGQQARSGNGGMGLQWRSSSPAALHKRNSRAAGPRSREQGLVVLRGIDVGLRRGFVGAVVQRSGVSTAAQELRAAEQGGRRELGFGAAAAMGMRRRGPRGAI